MTAALIEVGQPLDPGQYDTAPLGTVVMTGNGRHHLVRLARGWLCVECDQVDNGNLRGRVVVYVPEAAS